MISQAPKDSWCYTSHNKIWHLLPYSPVNYVSIQLNSILKMLLWDNSTKLWITTRTSISILSISIHFCFLHCCWTLLKLDMIPRDARLGFPQVHLGPIKRNILSKHTCNSTLVWMLIFNSNQLCWPSKIQTEFKESSQNASCLCTLTKRKILKLRETNEGGLAKSVRLGRQAN